MSACRLGFLVHLNRASRPLVNNETYVKTHINWTVYFILLIASILATMAVIPYTLEVQSEALAQQEFPIPLAAIIALQMVQNGIILATLIFVGMILANRIGLGTPILDALTSGASVFDKIRADLPVSLVLGVMASFLIIGLDVYLFQSRIVTELGPSADALTHTPGLSRWKGFLASFSGGIAEEIQLRFFAMSLLAWLGSFVRSTIGGRPTQGVLWLANVGAAILFGLGHLPAVASIVR